MSSKAETAAREGREGMMLCEFNEQAQSWGFGEPDPEYLRGVAKLVFKECLRRGLRPFLMDRSTNSETSGDFAIYIQWGESSAYSNMVFEERKRRAMESAAIADAVIGHLYDKAQCEVH